MIYFQLCIPGILNNINITISTTYLTSTAVSAILHSKIHDCIDNKLIYNSDSTFYMMRSKYNLMNSKSGICRVIFMERSPDKTVTKRRSLSNNLAYDLSVSRSDVN